jgi:hypothetical protein
MSGPAFGSLPFLVAAQNREPTFVDTYSNQLRIGATLNDFTITFGITDDQGPGQIHTKDRVAVHLAPGTAKLLVANLRALVEAYEAAISPIVSPDGLDERLKELTEEFASALKEQLKAPGITGRASKAD